MAQSQHTPQSWLDTAVRDIPGKAERRAVWAELSGHIQERMDSLQQTFPSLPPEEIQARALTAMGDAEEIGRALAQVHSPWPGRLLWLSRGVLLAVAVSLVVLLSDPPSYDLAREERGVSWLAGQTMEERLEEEYGPIQRLDRRGVYAAKTSQAGAYTFRLVQGTLWTFQGEAGEEGVLYLVVEAKSCRPWEPVSPAVWEGMEARDDRGNTLPYVDAGAGVWADGLLGGGVLEQSKYTQQVEFILPLPDPEAETVTLGYSGLGEEVVLSLSLKEETP